LNIEYRIRQEKAQTLSGILCVPCGAFANLAIQKTALSQGSQKHRKVAMAQLAAVGTTLSLCQPVNGGGTIIGNQNREISPGPAYMKN
jgi:hypothetical protein